MITPLNQKKPNPKRKKKPTKKVSKKTDKKPTTAKKKKVIEKQPEAIPEPIIEAATPTEEINFSCTDGIWNLYLRGDFRKDKFNHMMDISQEILTHNPSGNIHIHMSELTKMDFYFTQWLLACTRHFEAADCNVSLYETPKLWLNQLKKMGLKDRWTIHDLVS